MVLCFYLAISRSENNLLLGWPYHTSDCTLLQELVTNCFLISPTTRVQKLKNSFSHIVDALYQPLISNFVHKDDVVSLSNRDFRRIRRKRNRFDDIAFLAKLTIRWFSSKLISPFSHFVIEEDNSIIRTDCEFHIVWRPSHCTNFCCSLLQLY